VGYVAYPPLTPFLARIAFILFGPSLIGLRFFAAVALGLVLVLTGLMARHLGGEGGANRGSVAAAIGGVHSAGTLFQYRQLDYLWWARLRTSWFACLPQRIPAGVSLSGLIGLC
jgi:hypothetical protein